MVLPIQYCFILIYTLTQFIYVSGQTFIGAGISCQWDKIHVTADMPNKTTSLPSPAVFISITQQLDPTIFIGLQLGDYRVRSKTETSYTFNDPSDKTVVANFDWHFTYWSAYFGYIVYKTERSKYSVLGSAGIVGRRQGDYYEPDGGYIDDEYYYWKKAIIYDGFHPQAGLGVQAEWELSKRLILRLNANFNTNINKGKRDELLINELHFYRSTNQQRRSISQYTNGENLRFGFSLNYLICKKKPPAQQ